MKHNLSKTNQTSKPYFLNLFFTINRADKLAYINRLKFIEGDGKESLSKTISLVFTDDLPKMRVASNPFSDESVVNYANLKGKTKVYLYNMVGTAVWSINLENTEGSFKVGASLSTGVYFLKIENNQSQGMETIRLIKVK